MTKPNNQTSEVLFELILNKEMTRKDFFNCTGILNVTARIANLRNKGIDIKCRKVKTQNKHGRHISYGAWSIEDKDGAKNIYEIINK